MGRFWLISGPRIRISTLICFTLYKGWPTKKKKKGEKPQETSKRLVGINFCVSPTAYMCYWSALCALKATAHICKAIQESRRFLRRMGRLNQLDQLLWRIGNTKSFKQHTWSSSGLHKETSWASTFLLSSGSRKGLKCFRFWSAMCLHFVYNWPQIVSVCSNKLLLSTLFLKREGVREIY